MAGAVGVVRVRPVVSIFTPSHRGGSGPPLVCLHGFTDTWRTWEPGLPFLERRHEVHAPTLPWPSSAARYRRDWLPQADRVELEDVGHCPQLDVPLETAQLILGFTLR